MECYQSCLGLGLGSALAADENGLLVKRMEEAVDGDYQKYSVEPALHPHALLGKYPALPRWLII
jgi:pyruvate dehydrogenase complex dehydrogenase (E1) component